VSEELVSVVVPCRNGEKHLRAALASALAQTHAPIEVLFVDDASTDGSLAIARSFGERVRVVEAGGRGVAAARNLGLRDARGEFVHFLDADDVLPARAIEEKLAVFRLFPETDAVYSRSFVPFDPDVSETVVLPRGFADLVRRGRLTRATGFGERLGVPCPPCTPVLYRRAILERSGGFDPAVPVQENLELNLRLYLDGARFLYLDRIGLVYRDDHRIARETDRETYRSPALLEGLSRLAETARSRGALGSEIGDHLAAAAIEAGHEAAAHGDVRLADGWFAFANRLRPGAVPSRPLLRPFVRWLGPGRASRLDRWFRHLASKIGLVRRRRR